MHMNNVIQLRYVQGDLTYVLLYINHTQKFSAISHYVAARYHNRQTYVAAQLGCGNTRWWWWCLLQTMHSVHHNNTAIVQVVD